MKARAALGRSARHVVLHAIAGEDFHLPVVHLGGNRNFQDALSRSQNLAQAGLKLQKLRRHVELNVRDAEWIEIFSRRNARNDRWYGGLGDRGHRLSVLSGSRPMRDLTRLRSSALRASSSFTWPDNNRKALKP